MSPELARHYANEFAGVFAPALPPHGFEELVAEMRGWPTPIDRFASVVTGFLDNMPSLLTCEGAVLAGMGGYNMSPCQNRVDLSQLETELELCRDCFNRAERGDWRP